MLVCMSDTDQHADTPLVNWSDLGLSGSHAVRDLVSRTDLGSFSGSWTASSVPAHGSRLIKVS